MVSEQIGLILRRTIDADRLLTEYGLDSLSSQELRTRIESETGIRITATDINTTVRGLADLMYENLAPRGTRRRLPDAKCSRTAYRNERLGSPMKFVLAVHGTRGDVEPCAAVGVELQRRGHEVRWRCRPT